MSAGLVAAGVPRADSRTAAALAVAGAALLAGSGAEHLDLYLTGYDAVPEIGVLFVLQAASALAIAAAIFATSVLVVAAPAYPAPDRRADPAGRGVVRAAARLGPVASAGGALLALGTLAGYLVSLAHGLLGFKEVPTVAGGVAGGIEILAFVALSAHLLVGGRHLLAARLGVARGALVATTLAASGALAATLAWSGAPAASGTGRRLVTVVDLAGYGRVLATTGHRSLYLLSDEDPGHLTCTGECLSLWPPLYAGASTGSVQAGSAGSFSVVARGGGRHQLTDNGYPLYTFVGDRGPGQASGEGIASNGGVWYLVSASATRRADTPVTRRR